MKIPKAELLHDQLSSRISHLENEIIKSAYRLENLSLSRLSYGINLHIDNQSEIEEKLDQLGVKFIRIFGEEAKKPDRRVVAVADHLPESVINEVLIMAKDLGFEFYSYISAFEEIEEDVLFGAYGETEGKISIKIPTK